MTDEQLKLRESMPTTADGYIMSLFYIPPGQIDAYEAQWREWATKHPRRVWPAWLDAWAEKRKAEKANAPA